MTPDNRDARIEAIIQRYKNKEISYATMQEEILFSDEEADDRRRRANGVA